MAQGTCERCDSPTKGGLCNACIADECDDMDYGEPCWNCGGDGVVYDCFEEYACIDPESGCDQCMTRCDVCQPALHRN